MRSAFLFEPNPPHKLTGLLVEDSDAPAAAQADDLPATLTETQLVDAVDKHLARAVITQIAKPPKKSRSANFWI